MSILKYKIFNCIRQHNNEKYIATNDIHDVLESVFYPNEIEYAEIEGKKYYLLSDIVPHLKSARGKKLSHQYIVEHIDNEDRIALKRYEMTKFLKVDPSRMRYETEYLISAKGLYKLLCWLNESFENKYPVITLLNEMIAKVASSNYDIAKYILEHNG